MTEKKTNFHQMGSPTIASPTLLIEVLANTSPEVGLLFSPKIIFILIITG